MPEGGVAYIRAIEPLDGLSGTNADETTGIAIVRRAIEEPLRQIVQNSGLEGSIIVQRFVRVRMTTDSMSVRRNTNLRWQQVL